MIEDYFEMNIIAGYRIKSSMSFRKGGNAGNFGHPNNETYTKSPELNVGNVWGGGAMTRLCRTRLYYI